MRMAPLLASSPEKNTVCSRTGTSGRLEGPASSASAAPGPRSVAGELRRRAISLSANLVDRELEGIHGGVIPSLFPSNYMSTKLALRVCLGNLGLKWIEVVCGVLKCNMN
jgi:hypothetical protein